MKICSICGQLVTNYFQNGDVICISCSGEGVDMPQLDSDGKPVTPKHQKKKVYTNNVPETHVGRGCVNGILFTFLLVIAILIVYWLVRILFF